MRFDPVSVVGAYVVHLEPQMDERGAFARTYCAEEFRRAGIDLAPVQCNLSRNRRARTLRGMHFQRPPHEEAKLVQCVKGRVFDAIVDLRRGSPSFGKASWAELSDENDRMFYIPPGCAHGFLTIEPNSDLVYYMGSSFVAGAGEGLRWNDPSIDIPWPASPELISERDANYPVLASLDRSLLS
jgi:dTDP-4-dehydrorhamnose 3,5-epimerase